MILAYNQNLIYDLSRFHWEKVEGFNLTSSLSIIMSEWNYVQDVKKDKAENFCKEAMKKHSNRIYKIATARSNNPGMIAVYYREKCARS